MTKKKRGLAAMPPKKRKEIAKLGGTTAATKQTLHKFSRAEQSAGGKKGGAVFASKPGWMSEIAKRPRKRNKRNKRKGTR